MQENKYLITPTLLNSFNYFIKSESEDAFSDFEKIIKKEFTTNKYCEAGNMWEDRVCNLAISIDDLINDNKIKEVDKLVLEVANKVNNSDYQVPVQKEIIINNMNILLYGKVDAMGYDRIYDIKTISSDYEIGKYNDSMQHRIYMYCSPIKQFEYLITKIKIKEDEETKEVLDVIPTDNFAEYYAWQERYESDIYECINNFFEYLKANKELEKAYLELWKCKC
jgi:hypothetical protein